MRCSATVRGCSPRFPGYHPYQVRGAAPRTAHRRADEVVLQEVVHPARRAGAHDRVRLEDEHLVRVRVSRVRVSVSVRVRVGVRV